MIDRRREQWDEFAWRALCTPTERIVLLTIARFADVDTGALSTSYQEIAKASSLPVPTVRRAVRTLADVGYIDREVTVDEHGNRGPDQYFLLLPAAGTRGVTGMPKILRPAWH